MRGLTGLSLLILPLPAMAQAPRDIVVTAPTPLGVATPGAAFDATDLDRAHAIDLTDYLRRMSGGVFVNDIQNNPLQPDINYRGFTASPLLGTPQGLSVFVDGVRVNQPFGDVVSWDLIPKSAIRSVALVPGANPLFGRNTLGGAIAVVTKDGRSDPGFRAEASAGSFRRRVGSLQAGGAQGPIDWFASLDGFREQGWRDYSRSKAAQGFAKLGWSDAAGRIDLSLSRADTDLNGNGLQEMRLLEADRASVYTQPDNTRNRAWLANLTARRTLSDDVTLSANAFWRRIDTRTLNGDINDDSLGESLYQPSVAERAALAAAGYSGVPASGETQANTPFPRFRCIANALLNSEPNEKCDGLINRSRTRQHEQGGSGELRWRTARIGTLTFGASWVQGSAVFGQTSQFAYLTPDRGVIGVTGPGAFADGTQASENAFDARVDLAARTTSLGAFVLDTIDFAPSLRLDLSARYDRTNIHNRDRLTPGGGPGSLDTDQRFERVNPAATLRWTASPHVSADVTLAQASRAPSATELGCADPENPCRLPNALAGDPPLDQVIARTAEAGIDLRLGRWTVRLGAFRTVNRDDILFVTDDAAGFGYFRNFGRTRRQGVDLDLRGTLGALRLAAHYAFLDATYRSAETVDGSANSSADHVAPGFEGDIDIARGNRIPLIPRHNFKASVDWSATRAVSLGADLVALSGAPARGNENSEHRADGVYYLGPGRSDGYAVVNFNAEWRPVRRLALFARVDNIFDRKYATAAQLAQTGFDATGAFVARPFAGPVIGGERPLLSSTFYAPGSPRAVRVGARLTL